jgi:hypothetical protein
VKGSGPVHLTGEERISLGPREATLVKEHNFESVLIKPVVYRGK